MFGCNSNIKKEMNIAYFIYVGKYIENDMFDVCIQSLRKQSDCKIVENSLSIPSTEAATQSCFLPSMSITISPAVIPAAYSFTEPSGRVTEIIGTGVASASFGGACILHLGD